MALTPENVKALTAPFALREHYWRQGGKGRELVYIEEEAISTRLDSVDPAWELTVMGVWATREKEVAAHVRLTVCGVTRDGIGQAEVGGAEAEKTAATDAFKRAARLFGIGRYLLNPPDKAQFGAWLANLGKSPAPTASPFADLAQVEPDNEPLSPNSLSSLMLEAKRKGVTDAQLLAALGCKEKWGEFKGTMSEARAILDQTAKALKAASGKEPLKEGML